MVSSPATLSPCSIPGVFRYHRQCPLLSLDSRALLEQLIPPELLKVVHMRSARGILFVSCGEPSIVATPLLEYPPLPFPFPPLPLPLPSRQPCLPASCISLPLFPGPPPPPPSDPRRPVRQLAPAALLALLLPSCIDEQGRPLLGLSISEDELAGAAQAMLKLAPPPPPPAQQQSLPPVSPARSPLKSSLPPPASHPQASHAPSVAEMSSPARPPMPPLHLPGNEPSPAPSAAASSPVVGTNAAAPEGASGIIDDDSPALRVSPRKTALGTTSPTRAHLQPVVTQVADVPGNVGACAGNSTSGSDIPPDDLDEFLTAALSVSSPCLPRPALSSSASTSSRASASRTSVGDSPPPLPPPPPYPAAPPQAPALSRSWSTTPSPTVPAFHAMPLACPEARLSASSPTALALSPPSPPSLTPAAPLPAPLDHSDGATSASAALLVIPRPSYPGSSGVLAVLPTGEGLPPLATPFALLTERTTDAGRTDHPPHPPLPAAVSSSDGEGSVNEEAPLGEGLAAFLSAADEEGFNLDTIDLVPTPLSGTASRSQDAPSASGVTGITNVPPTPRPVSDSVSTATPGQPASTPRSASHTPEPSESPVTTTTASASALGCAGEFAAAVGSVVTPRTPQLLVPRGSDGDEGPLDADLGTPFVTLAPGGTQTGGPAAASEPPLALPEVQLPPPTMAQTFTTSVPRLPDFPRDAAHRAPAQRQPATPRHPVSRPPRHDTRRLPATSSSRPAGGKVGEQRPAAARRRGPPTLTTSPKAVPAHPRAGPSPLAARPPPSLPSYSASLRRAAAAATRRSPRGTSDSERAATSDTSRGRHSDATEPTAATPEVPASTHGPPLPGATPRSVVARGLSSGSSGDDRDDAPASALSGSGPPLSPRRGASLSPPPRYQSPTVSAALKLAPPGGGLRVAMAPARALFPFAFTPAEHHGSKRGHSATGSGSSRTQTPSPPPGARRSASSSSAEAPVIGGATAGTGTPPLPARALPLSATNAAAAEGSYEESTTARRATADDDGGIEGTGKPASDNGSADSSDSTTDSCRRAGPPEEGGLAAQAAALCRRAKHRLARRRRQVHRTNRSEPGSMGGEAQCGEDEASRDDEAAAAPLSARVDQFLERVMSRQQSPQPGGSPTAPTPGAPSPAGSPGRIGVEAAGERGVMPHSGQPHSIAAVPVAVPHQSPPPPQTARVNLDVMPSPTVLTSAALHPHSSQSSPVGNIQPHGPLEAIAPPSTARCHGEASTPALTARAGVVSSSPPPTTLSVVAPSPRPPATARRDGEAMSSLPASARTASSGEVPLGATPRTPGSCQPPAEWSGGAAPLDDEASPDDSALSSPLSKGKHIGAPVTANSGDAVGKGIVEGAAVSEELAGESELEAEEMETADERGAAEVGLPSDEAEKPTTHAARETAVFRYVPRAGTLKQHRAYLPPSTAADAAAPGEEGGTTSPVDEEDRALASRRDEARVQTLRLRNKISSTDVVVTAGTGSTAAMRDTVDRPTTTRAKEIGPAVPAAGENEFAEGERVESAVDTSRQASSANLTTPRPESPQAGINALLEQTRGPPGEEQVGDESSLDDAALRAAEQRLEAELALDVISSPSPALPPPQAALPEPTTPRLGSSNSNDASIKVTAPPVTSMAAVSVTPRPQLSLIGELDAAAIQASALAASSTPTGRTGRPSCRLVGLGDVVARTAGPDAVAALSPAASAAAAAVAGEGALAAGVSGGRRARRRLPAPGSASPMVYLTPATMLMVSTSTSAPVASTETANSAGKGEGEEAAPAVPVPAPIPAPTLVVSVPLPVTVKPATITTSPFALLAPPDEAAAARAAERERRESEAIERLSRPAGALRASSADRRGASHGYATRQDTRKPHALLRHNSNSGASPDLPATTPPRTTSAPTTAAPLLPKASAATEGNTSSLALGGGDVSTTIPVVAVDERMLLGQPDAPAPQASQASEDNAPSKTSSPSPGEAAIEATREGVPPSNELVLATSGDATGKALGAPTSGSSREPDADVLSVALSLPSTRDLVALGPVLPALAASAGPNSDRTALARQAAAAFAAEVRQMNDKVTQL